MTSSASSNITRLWYSLYTRLTWPQLHTNMETRTHTQSASEAENQLTACQSGPEESQWTLAHTKTCRKDQWACVYRATYPSHSQARSSNTTSPHHHHHHHQVSDLPLDSRRSEGIDFLILTQPSRKRPRQQRRERRRERAGEDKRRWGGGRGEREEGVWSGARCLLIRCTTLERSRMSDISKALNFGACPGLWNVKNWIAWSALVEAVCDAVWRTHDPHALMEEMGGLVRRTWWVIHVFFPFNPLTFPVSPLAQVSRSLGVVGVSV